MKKTYSVIISAVSGSILLSSLGFIGEVIKSSGENFSGELHYLFVLGGRIIGKETPSEHLLKRILKAAEYLKAHPDTVAITCGGCFREGQTKSEALIIKEFLIRLGIEENRILLEDKSTTTNENFSFGKKIIEEHSGKELYELKAGLLSSDYHLFRAGIIAKINGLPGLKKIGAKSTLKDFIRGASRELIVAPDLINNLLSEK